MIPIRPSKFAWRVLLALTALVLVVSDAPALATPQPSPTPSPTPAAEADDPVLLEEHLANLHDLLRMELAENSFKQLLISFLIILAAFVLRKLLLVVVFRYLGRRQLPLLKDKSSQFTDVLQGPSSTFVVVLGVYLATIVLTLPPGGREIIDRLFFAGTLVVIFWGLIRFTDLIADILHEKWMKRDLSLASFVPLLKRTVRVFVIILGAVLVVQNLGYQVTSLLAGLGIGGLAVALAAQESLSNFFGSLVVAADRPFKVGDWIQIDDKVNGMVEEIGLRSTKVRTWANTLLFIPNKMVSNEIVENWTRMTKRRVSFNLGVTYETPPDVIEQLVEDFRKILEEDEGVHQQTIIVNFTEFADSSLNIFVYYFTIPTTWKPHLEVRQRINLKLMRAVAARGSSVAFPTRTLHLAGPNPFEAGVER